MEEIKKIQMFLTCDSWKGGRGWRLELLIGQTGNMYVPFDKKKTFFKQHFVFTTSFPSFCGPAMDTRACAKIYVAKLLLRAGTVTVN